MPEVFRQGGFRFYFYSNEGDPREPLHIHVRRDEDRAKIWLTPNVILAESLGFNAQDLRGSGDSPPAPRGDREGLE